MYYPPYGYPPIQIPPTDNPIDTWIKVNTFLEGLKKENETKEKEKKSKKPDPRKFSFMETAFMCMFFGPALGFGYLYAIKFLLFEVDKLIK
jgi:hypothetical protein